MKRLPIHPMQTLLQSEELLIRIPETGGDFIYTITQGGAVVRTAVVYVVDPSPDSGDVFHGGSQAMD